MFSELFEKNTTPPSPACFNKVLICRISYKYNTGKEKTWINVNYVIGLDGQAVILDGYGDGFDCGFGKGVDYSALSYNL